MKQASVTRRTFLGYGIGAAGLAGLVAACSQPAPTVPAQAPSHAPTQAPARATSAATNVAAPAATSAPAAATGVQIQIATRGGTDGQIMIKTAEEFTKKTGIKATHVAYGPEPEYWSKVEALYATKQLADVVWASSGNQLNFANRGMLADLDPIIKADNYDMSDYLQNGLTSMSLKGKLYGMPWGAHPGNGGLVYNADMLQQAGFTKVTDDPETVLDWSYDTLMQAAQKATKKNGDRIDVYGYLPGTDYLSLTNVLGAYGADFLNADGTQLTMDTPEFLKGMQWVYDAFITNKVSPAPGANGDQLFDSQKLAMELSGYWGQFQPGIKDNAFKWNDSLQPVGPTGKRGTHLTINGQCLSSITKHQKEAWEFVKFIMSPEQNIQIVLSGGGRPAARKSVLESQELIQKMKAHKVWVKAIETAEPWRQPANFRWPEFNTTIQQAFANCWIGKQSIEQTLPDAKKLLQAVLDKPAAK
jgi:multiple sugar transport system substrate-binding protein